jgi:hypothetical protein
MLDSLFYAASLMRGGGLDRLLRARAMNRHRQVLPVGQFGKKLCNTMSENCPTFLLSL